MWARGARRQTPRALASGAESPTLWLSMKKPNLGPNSKQVNEFFALLNGLTDEQVARLSASYRRQYDSAFLQATAAAWTVARRRGLQGAAEHAHNMAYAALARDRHAAEAASFAVLPIVLGARLSEPVAVRLSGPWHEFLANP